MSTIRIVIALAAELGQDLHQFDFNSAYLNKDIEEELYISVPPEFQKILTAKEKTRKNAIVEYLDYQIPVTQLNRDMQVAKGD